MKYFVLFIIYISLIETFASEDKSGLLGVSRNSKIEMTIMTAVETAEKAIQELVDLENRPSGVIRMNAYQYFAKPRETINSVLELTLTNHGLLSQDLLDEFLVRYLLLNARTAGGWTKLIDNSLLLCERSRNAKVLYLMGYTEFKKQELGSGSGDYTQVLKYLNKALEINPQFPEAYWLRSQVFAIQGGQLGKVKSDQSMVKEFASYFDGYLYLYDDGILSAILESVNASLE